VKVVNKLSELRLVVSEAKTQQATPVLVPTMGNLHDGHLALVREAHKHGDFIVVSVFVNPTQFGVGEDLESYPRTPREDQQKLSELDVDVVFVPSIETMYANGLDSPTNVHVPNLGENFCGRDRPGHFDGVTSVVCRLFNMVQPEVAVFGKKDYQQLSIIRRMTHDLGFNIDIIGVDIVRSSAGLALSSRNGYLSSDELETAAKLQKTLQELKAQIVRYHHAGRLDLQTLEALEQKARDQLVVFGFKPHYLQVCDQKSLLRPDHRQDKLSLVLLAAAGLAGVRLVDNREIEL